MDSLISSDEVATALALVIRRRLARGDSVDLPQLGRLEVRHERSTIEEHPDGNTTMQPPKDHVVFIPND